MMVNRALGAMSLFQKKGQLKNIYSLKKIAFDLATTEMKGLQQIIVPVSSCARTQHDWHSDFQEVVCL